MRENLDILLLCDMEARLAATVTEHVGALVSQSRHRIRPLRMLGDIPAAIDLPRFDGVIIHYSLVACRDSHFSPDSRRRLAAFSGLKTMFIQDEYRHVDQTVAAMQEMGVDLLFTCVPESEIEMVYPAAKLPGMTKVNVLTGYVPTDLSARQVPALMDRPIDVGYRARQVPAWLGELGQEKWRIGHRFLADAERFGLRCDISYREEDRLYGEDWNRFLMRCRATLGAESGASVFDFSGEIQRRVDTHVLRAPHTPFSELQRLYFAKEEGKIRLNQISPRCFEAAALRTLMILYEGDYSGILVPGRHYVPLKKDHSNISEVVRVLHDAVASQAIVDCAYQEIALNPAHGFPAFVANVDAQISTRFAAPMAKSRPAYDSSTFRRASRPGFATRYRVLKRDVVGALYRLLFRKLLAFLPEAQRDVAKIRIRAGLKGFKAVAARVSSLGRGTARPTKSRPQKGRH